MTLRFIFAFLFGCSTVTGQSIKVVPVQTHSLGDDSVLIAFRILGQNGKPVDYLAKSDIVIRDNSAYVSNFSLEYREPPGNRRTYTVLLLDASGSMRQNRKIERLKLSAIDFVRALSSEDLCSVIMFSTRPNLLSGFSNDKEFLERQINSITAGGYTAIYDGMLESLVQLESQPESSNKMILLVSDGEDDGASLFKLSDISPRLRAMKNLTVHTFDLDNRENAKDLKRLAYLGNGNYAFGRSLQSVFSSFASFVEQHRKAYVLSYQLSESDETLHKATVSFRLGGLRHQFETEYEKVFIGRGSIFTLAASSYIGGVLLAAGIAVGVTVLIRKKRYNPQFVVDSRGGLILGEPRRPLLLHRRLEVEDNTTAMQALRSDDDERTIIIEDRKKSVVLGNLTLTRSDGTEEEIEIDSPEVLIGRNPQCRVRIDEVEVSRLHAKLRLEMDGFVLYDLGSANGSFVNGEEVQKTLLKDGDRIQIGNNRIVFKSVGTNP